MPPFELSIEAIRDAQRERRRDAVRSTSARVYHQLEAEGELEKSRGRVYQLLYWHGPLTSKEVMEELAARDGYRTVPQTRARFTELREMGAICEVGETVCSISGKDVILWDVTDQNPHPLPRRVKGPTRNQLMDRVAELEAMTIQLKEENAGLRQLLRKRRKDVNQMQLFGGDK